MSSKILLLPIRFITYYVIIGLCIFCFGPIKYTVDYRIDSVIYMSIFLIVANIVYKNSIRTTNQNSSFIEEPSYVDKLTRFCIVYSVVLELLLILESAMMSGVNVSINLARLFETAAESYTEDEYIYTKTGWILSYTYVFVNMALTLGFYKIGSLDKRSKYLLFSLFPILIIYNTFFVGSMKAVIDYGMYIFAGFIFKSLRENAGIKGLPIKKSQLLLIIILFGFLGTFFLGSVKGRQTMWQEQYHASFNAVPGDYDYVDYDNILIKYVPDDYKEPIVTLCSYLTQGYFGLSLCLQTPFEWSAFTGTSFKIKQDIERWTGSDIGFADSYPVRTELRTQYPAYAAWHTVFPWFASDFTYIGAIIVVCLLVSLLAKAWARGLIHGDITSILVCSNLFIFFFHIAGTNHMFIRRNTLICMFIIFIMWKKHSKYYI